MRKKVPVLVVLWLLLLNVTTGSAEELGTLFKNIYGPKGLVVDSEAVLNPGDSAHFAHFNSSFQSSFNLFNIAMASLAWTAWRMPLVIEEAGAPLQLPRLPSTDDRALVKRDGGNALARPLFSSSRRPFPVDSSSCRTCYHRSDTPTCGRSRLGRRWHFAPGK